MVFIFRDRDAILFAGMKELIFSCPCPSRITDDTAIKKMALLTLTPHRTRTWLFNLSNQMCNYLTTIGYVLAVQKTEKTEKKSFEWHNTKTHALIFTLFTQI